MTTLWDLFAAQEARDEAISRADDNANDAWKKAALDTLLGLARTRCTFTSDDFWHTMECQHPDVSTHEGRALGALMKKAQKAGWIEPTPEFVSSSRKSCHAAPIRKWHSLLPHSCGRAA